MENEITVGRPADVGITARLHPMRSESVVAFVHAGASIATILDDVSAKNGIRDWYQQNVYVELNGVPVRQNDFSTTYVAQTDHLVVQFCVPQGGGGKKGGKNPLRIILTVVVMIVAWYAGGAVAAAYGQAAGALAQGAVMMIGSMAVNALVPVTGLTDTGLGHDSSTESDIYSISGMRNYNPRYKSLPMVLGRVRFAPPYGALPYTRIEGNDQYLHCDVVWGHGELDIAELKLGETLLASYDDVEVATNRGTTDDTELSLYPDDVWEESVSAVLSYGVEVVRTSQLAADAIGLDLVFAQGLFCVDAETGERKDTTVEIEVYIRTAGDTVWGSPATYTVTDTAAYSKRVHFDVPISASDQYDVKLVRITEDAETVKENTESGEIYDELTWSIIRTTKYQDPVTFDVPIAETQLIIKATDQLSGVIDNLNAVVTSVCLDYDAPTDSWLKRSTSNPASLFRHVLQGPGSAKPLADNLIDLAALEEWHIFCESQGFEYNKVHDGQMSVQNVLNDICHAGRATFVMVDDARSVVVDTARNTGPVQLFTPENSLNFSSTKAFVDDVHGYRVLFNNEAADFAEDEITVYAEGYNAGNATLFEALEFHGVTSAEQTASLTKYHLATRRYRLETFSWEADWEHIVCNRGDLVRVSHPALLVALCSGRIRNIDQAAKTITLDQELTVNPGVLYGVVIRTTPTDELASQVFTLQVFAEVGVTATFTWLTPDVLPVVVGDLYSAGELGSETLDLVVTSKRPAADMRGTVTALSYSWPEIEAYLAGEYPDYVTGVTTPVFTPPLAPLVPTVTSIMGGLSVAETRQDGSVNARIVVLVSIPSGGRVPTREVQAEIRGSGGWQRSACVDPGKPLIFNDIAPGDVDVRVRSVSETGTVSTWVYASYVQTTAYAAPNGVTGLAATGNLFQNDLSWVLASDYRSQYRIEVWGATGVNNRVSASLLATLGGGKRWSHAGLDPAVDYYYWVRVIGETGLASVWFPESATGGVAERPVSDPGRILDMLAASISESELAVALSAKIDGAADGFSSHQELLENIWTLKIQENAGGEFYSSGAGLAVYPNWFVGAAYAADTYIWHPATGETYKSSVGHVASAANEPPNSSFWQLVPNGAKSQFVVQADQFAVVNASGEGKKYPLVISGGVVGIDGELVIDGSVTATALHANALTSNNYVAGASGFRLDAAAGTAEFNNITMTFNYGNLSGVPESLADINSAESSKLAGVEAGATVGSYLLNGATSAGLTAFTNGREGVPSLMPDLTGTAITNDADFGKCIEVTNWSSAGNNALTKNVVPIVSGRIYRISVTFKVTVLPPDSSVNFNIVIVSHDESYGNGVNLFDYQSTLIDTLNHVRTVSRYVSTDSLPSPITSFASTAQVFRAGIRMDSSETGPVSMRFKSIIIEDATEAYYAELASKSYTENWSAQGATANRTDAATDAAIAAVADSKATLAETQAKAYADGIVSTEEQRAITEAKQNYYLARKAAFAAGTQLYVLTDSGSIVTNTTYANGHKYTFTSPRATSAIIRVKTTDAEGGVCFGLNAVEIGTMHYSGDGFTNPDNSVYNSYFVVDLLQGSNEVSIWSKSSDGGQYGGIEVRTTGAIGVVDGADVTSENTAADTANVGGTSAATIRDNALAAKAAVVAMEADNRFSVAEKRTWAEQWPGMVANYDVAIAAANSAGVSATDLVSKKNTLTTALTNYGVFAATLTTSNMTAGYLSGTVANYYTALSSVIAATSAAKAATAESNAISSANSIDFAAKINANTTTISGGKITTNSITASHLIASAVTTDKLASAVVTASKISAGAIETGHMKASSVTTETINGNAVSECTAITNTALYPSTLTIGPVTIATVVVNTTGNSVLLQFNGWVRAMSSGSYRSYLGTVLLKRNGVTVRTLAMEGSSYDISRRMYMYVDTPSAGTHTYTVVITYGTAAVQAEDFTFAAISLKR
jgi:hypothetical protein